MLRLGTLRQFSFSDAVDNSVASATPQMAVNAQVSITKGELFFLSVGAGVTVWLITRILGGGK